MTQTYMYKHYRAGLFLGVLDELVASEFNLSSEINTAGSQLTIDLAVGFQGAGAEVTNDLLITEVPDFIVTEQLENIIVNTDVTIERIPALNDFIEVWEFNDFHPTGVVKFRGIVTGWESKYTENSTRLTCLSRGVKLDNFLVQILPNTAVVSNPTGLTPYTLYANSAKIPQNRTIGIAQTFTISTPVDVDSVKLFFQNTGSFSVGVNISIVSGTPTSPGSVVATTSINVPVQSMQESIVQFASLVSLSPGTYHLAITNATFGFSENNAVAIGIDTGGGYADGLMYDYNDSTGYSSTAYDINFVITTPTGGVGNTFNSQDPSTIFTDLIDTFQSLGGDLTYDSDSIEVSGTTVSYTFKFNTFLEAVKKVIELAPANWWWWVDPATETIYFRSLGQTVDHRFALGAHIQDLTIAYSLEQVINTVYFTGGDDGSGTNLQVNYSDPTSVATYGTWLDTISDNRVTREDTAEIIAESRVNQFKDPRFRTTVVIPSSVYDLSTVLIGDIVGFSNTNDLIDSLQLQIMAKREVPGGAELVLAILPPTQSKRIEDIKRNLDNKITENNPETT